MMQWDSLRGVTLRALRIDYISPAVCELAVISSGSGSGQSATSVLNSTPVEQLAGPTNLVVTVNEFGEVTLTWDERPYIFAYAIYAGATADGPFILQTSNLIPSTFSYTPIESGTYFFKVTGIEPEFGETFPSNIFGPLVVNIP